MVRKFKTMDGNNAAAHVSYAYTEVAGIYPITPSSPMADFVDQWSAAGLKNIFGTRVKVAEDHLYGVSGSAADDPEYVQDRGGAAALCVPRLGSYRLDPCAEHFRRSF